MACWSSGMILAYGASATPGQSQEQEQKNQTKK